MRKNRTIQNTERQSDSLHKVQGDLLKVSQM